MYRLSDSYTTDTKILKII